MSTRALNAIIKTAPCTSARITNDYNIASFSKLCFFLVTWQAQSHTNGSTRHGQRRKRSTFEQPNLGYYTRGGSLSIGQGSKLLQLRLLLYKIVCSAGSGLRKGTRMGFLSMANDHEDHWNLQQYDRGGSLNIDQGS